GGTTGSPPPAGRCSPSSAASGTRSFSRSIALRGSAMPDLSSRVKHALASAGRPVDDDVAEELGTHAVAAYEAARADGCDHADALHRIDGLIATWIADADRLRRRPTRDPVVTVPPAGASAWSGLAHDVRYAARLLRRQPAFA